MSADEVNTIIEADTEVKNEEAPEISVEQPTEAVENKVVKPKAKPKATPKPEPKELSPDDFQTRAERIKHKKVKCEGCDAVLNLKTYRYTHKCKGKLEDKEIKPKPKAKVKAVAVKPLTNSSPLNDISNIEERIQQYQQPVQAPPEPKPFSIQDYYKQLRQDAVNRKKAEVDNLTKNIFKGCRAKKRF